MSCLWNIQFRDAYQAQYYLQYLKRSEKELKDQLMKTSQKILVTNNDDMTISVLAEIANQLDGILLASVAKELHEILKQLHQKTGTKNFMLKKRNGWTELRKFHVSILIFSKWLINCVSQQQIVLSMLLRL